MLVDTGPDECWPMLKLRLAGIPKNKDGKRVIDVLVISHIDHDHIGAATQLLSDRELGLSIGDVWFNAPSLQRARGVSEGQRLSDFLGAGDACVPWNRAFKGKLCVTSSSSLFKELPGKRGLPRLTVLSPSPATLTRLFGKWDRELERMRQRTHEPVPPRSEPRAALNLQALARKVTAVDQAAPNGSSIALLLEHRGASVLLGADAFPTVLTPALKALALSRKTPKGLKVNALKLSHHGSRGSTTLDLLKVVQADHYIVSTNGTIFGHPDDETIARIVTAGGRTPTLWFNYANDESRRWAQPGMQRAHGYRACLPREGTAGVTLGLAPPKAGGS
jgi:beta-lactamase superfamily II metal-dependent hydrolase